MLNASHKTKRGKLILTFGLGWEIILNGSQKQAQERCTFTQHVFQDSLDIVLGNTEQMQPSTAQIYSWKMIFFPQEAPIHSR